MTDSIIIKIFNNANGFRIVALRAEEMRPNPDGRTFECVPLQGRVNAAFACELYLKGLLKYANKETYTHDLEKLFSLLPDEIRYQIITFVKEQFDMEEETFMKKLKDVSDLFLNWRYLYEGDTAKKVNIDNSFILTLMELLNQISIPYHNN